jgi:pimeloyl-ACP methyl ester carboxylesterase
MLGLGLALALGVVVDGAAGTRQVRGLKPCASIDRVVCGYVSVPLDYAHPDRRRLRLFVAERPVQHARGTILLLAGGPGEASTSVFDLTSDLWRTLFPGYTVAAYDDRGTGGSGSLSCRGARTAERCGNAIGPSRVFYGTRENVLDLEAVRRALGVERVALFGLSYGTKQALAYALAYPTQVERLLLDSVVPADGQSPLGLESLRAVGDSLRSICHGGCGRAGRDPAGDFARLANALHARPLDAAMPIYRSSGWAPTKRRVHVDGRLLLELATAADLNAGVAVELPAAVREALDGRPLLLEHLAALVAQQSSADVNDAVLYATTCNDGPFPWRRDVPVARRSAMLAGALASLRPSLLYGFGSWAAGAAATRCLGWPSSQARVATGKLPDVPVLVLAGDRDVRTPLADGTAVARSFRRGRVLLAPGVGHMAVSSSSCTNRAVRTWMSGGVPPLRCPRVPLTIPPLAPLPASVAATAAIGNVGGEVGRTLAAAVRTLREAEASWLVAYPAGWVAGLRSGLLSGQSFDSFNYQAYSDVPGLAISGKLEFATSKLGTLVPRSEDGFMTIGSRIGGFVQIKKGRVFGIVGGRNVSARF